jgi:cell wall-associated NlpC family hydrolase
MGSNLHGNCRTLWDGTTRITQQDLKPGDLVFLQDTQPGKVAHGKASHVAIVTDVSKLGEGKISVAHNGSTGSSSKIVEWNLNGGYYGKHFLGAGRLVQNAKFGGKLDYSDAHE